MENNGRIEDNKNNKLPLLQQQQLEDCGVFNGYDASLLMAETAETQKTNYKERNT